RAHGPSHSSSAPRASRSAPRPDPASPLRPCARVRPPSSRSPYTTLFRSFQGKDYMVKYGQPSGVPLGTIADNGPRDAYSVYEMRSEEHTSELQSRFDLVCRLLRGKKNASPDDTHARRPTRAARAGGREMP